MLRAEPRKMTVFNVVVVIMLAAVWLDKRSYNSACNDSDDNISTVATKIKDPKQKHVFEFVLLF